jgi:hypothetical protein
MKREAAICSSVLIEAMFAVGLESSHKGVARRFPETFPGAL